MASAQRVVEIMSMQKYIARERLTVADDTTVTRGGCPTDVYLASDVDARIAKLEKALYALVTSHNGYRHGVGPCICAAHEEARKVLGITRGDETPQSLMGG